MRTNTARTIGYWAATGLVALDFLMGGAASLARPPVVVAGMEHLGYPSYFALLLGGWKILGSLALVAPRSPRLKEWAYAGVFFDLTGAAFSHAASGDGPGHVIPPLIFAVILAVSWVLRPQSRVLGELLPPASGRSVPREVVNA